MRKIYFGAVGLAALGLSGSAMAQENNKFDFTPVNVAVRAGIGLPLDSALSDYGSPLLGLGVEYQFGSSLSTNSVPYVSLDYLTASTEFNGGIFPLCINERFYLGGQKYRRTYAFVGVGGAIVNINKANAVVAARGGLGADVTDNVFFEATLLITDKAASASGDSVSFYVGYRF